MTINGWLILALIAGFTSVLGHDGVTGFNLCSMFAAVVGTIVLLVLYHALFRRRALTGRPV